MALKETKHKLWMRVGCTFWVTPEEAAILLSQSSDMDERTGLLRRLMLEGHFAARRYETFRRIGS